jgi:hypothetical protein
MESPEHESFPYNSDNLNNSTDRIIDLTDETGTRKLLMRPQARNVPKVTTQIEPEVPELPKTYFIALDPGFENLGYCYGYFQYTLDDNYHMGKDLKVVIDSKRSGTIALTDIKSGPQQMFMDIKRFFESTWTPDELANTAVFIEQQFITPPIQYFSHRLVVLFTTLFTFATLRCNFVALVQPKSIKSVCATSKKTYTQTKDATIDFCSNIGFEPKSHHEADAFTVAYTWLKKTLPKFNIVVKQ